MNPLCVCTSVHTLHDVEFVWDDEKARGNLRKHGVDFAEAVTALCDELALTLPDEAKKKNDLSQSGRTRSAE